MNKNIGSRKTVIVLNASLSGGIYYDFYKYFLHLQQIIETFLLSIKNKKFVINCKQTYTNPQVTSKPF